MMIMVVSSFMRNPDVDLSDLADLFHDIFIYLPSYAAATAVAQLGQHYQLHKSCQLLRVDILCEKEPESDCCTKCNRKSFSVQFIMCLLDSF